MKLFIVVDIPDEIGDPILTDPHEIAEDFHHFYNDHRRANGEPGRAEFVGAEWAGNAGALVDEHGTNKKVK